MSEKKYKLTKSKLKIYVKDDIYTIKPSDKNRKIDDFNITIKLDNNDTEFTHNNFSKVFRYLPDEAIDNIVELLDIDIWCKHFMKKLENGKKSIIHNMLENCESLNEKNIKVISIGLDKYNGLLSKYIDLIEDLECDSGYKLQHYLIMSGNFNILFKSGLDLNAVDSEGRNCLMLCYLYRLDKNSKNIKKMDKLKKYTNIAHIDKKGRDLMYYKNMYIII